MLKSTVLRAVATAKLAVQDLAVKCQLVNRGPAVHVPGAVPTYAETLYSISLVPTKFESDEIDGERIRASDIKGLIFPESADPTPGTNDLVRGDLDKSGVKDYRIIFNDVVYAGDSVALSQVHLRRL